MRSSPTEPMIQRLLGLLERLRGLRRGRSGDPALSELDTAAGRSRGHLRRQLKGEIRMSAGDLFRIFDLLGADPEEYLAAARRGRTPLELWLGETAREDRRQLRALRPARRAPAPPDLDGALRHLDRLLRLGQPEASETGPFLAALDTLAGDDSTEAGELRFRTWDLLGASYRFSARYSASAHCYFQALRQAAGRPLKRARILRRGCYLATDQCDFDDALHFADQAAEIYLHQRRLADVGRALIDSAITLFYMGRHQDAQARFELGLKVLDEDSQYRIAAQQSIGLCQVYCKKLVEAKRSLRLAYGSYNRMRAGPRQTTGLRLLAAEIALAEDDFLTAKTLLERVRSCYSETGNQLDYAAVSLRLAKALLLLGRHEDLLEVVSESTQLITSLSRHRLATAILGELQRCCTDGNLSARLLDQLYFEFKKRARTTRKS